MKKFKKCVKKIDELTKKDGTMSMKRADKALAYCRKHVDGLDFGEAILLLREINYRTVKWSVDDERTNGPRAIGHPGE